MQRKHRRTLQAIFTNPAPANLRWREIEALFRALGETFEEAAGSRVAVVLNRVPAVFHRPHPQPDARRSTVRAVRHFLIRAGIQPEGEDQ
jgi:HicA toxin of bacterial toxin-antitoxin,